MATQRHSARLDGRDARLWRVAARKEKSVKFLLRIPPELLERVKRLAEEETRSATGQVVQLIREALAARDAKER
jgi:hypothetical protein